MWLSIIIVICCAIFAPLFMQEIEWLAGLAGDTPGVRKLMRLARLDSTWQADVRVRLIRVLERQGVNLADPDPFLPWPTVDSLRFPGDFDIGEVKQTAQPVGLSLDRCANHIVVTGSHRVGKTTLARRLARFLKQHGIVQIIDTGRADFASLARDPDFATVAASDWRAKL